MAIFERIQRIIKANTNWLLDKIEPPQQELESKIRELESAIEEGRECAASYGATFRRMEKQADALAAEQVQWQAKAETAVAGGDDDVAREALSEKVRLGERIAALAPGVDQGKQTYEQLRDNLVHLADQLQAAKTKLAELKARQRAADAHKAFGKQLGNLQDVAEGDAFERMEDKVLQTEAEVEIQEDIRGQSMSAAELEQRSRELQVDAELRAMKEKLNEDQ